MKVRLIVPGESDRKTIPILLKKKFPGWHFDARPAGGDGKVEHKLEGIAQTLWDAGCNKVIAVRDAENENPLTIERRMRKKARASNVSICIANRSLEAWLLDPNALRSVLGRSVRIDRCKAENLMNPKAEMKKIFQAAGKENYHAPTHAPQIAKNADPDWIAKCCPSFKALVKLAKDP